MEETAPYISKNEKLDYEFPVKHAYTCKFYNLFLFKAMLVIVIFLVALPLFPSEVPKIISQYLHTRCWELLQLIFVGIAVSYGLFSKKSNDDETESEQYYNSKFDNVDQSTVSRLLQVSSFFDDEAENHDVCNENKAQTRYNQYHSSKPVVVVAKENAAFRNSRVISSRIVEKPLLLPIRSLKSPVLEPISTTTSPKSLSSPRKLSSSVSFSSESQAKIDDNFMRKQSFLKSSAPPPPPPLPPRPILRESTQLKSTFIVTYDKGTSENELKRCIKSVPMELRDEKQCESLYKGKSIRTIRPFIGAARARVLYGKDFINGKEETFVDKRECTDKLMHEKYHIASKLALMEIPNEEKKSESVEKVLEKTDEDLEFETEDDYFEESTGNVEVASKSVSDVSDVTTKNVSDGGPDVDKKADEFIAKFREQIRLQRIASSRRSAGLQPA